MYTMDARHPGQSNSSSSAALTAYLLHALYSILEDDLPSSELPGQAGTQLTQPACDQDPRTARLRMTQTTFQLKQKKNLNFIYKSIAAINVMLQSIVMYSARCRRLWGASLANQDDDQDFAQLRRKRESHRG